MFSRIFLILFCLLPSIGLNAQEFVLKNIKVEGIKRVSLGSVSNALDLKAGDKVDTLALQQASRRIYATGYFDDIELRNDDDVLIIILNERPLIKEINISGNKIIPSNKLKEAFRDAGIVKGEILLYSTLDNIIKEIERLYYLQGRYGTKIEVNTDVLDENRVVVNINIKESDSAKVLKVDIIGNKDFSDERIRSWMNTKNLNNLTTITGSNNHNPNRLISSLYYL